jgi:hypothetical protein
MTSHLTLKFTINTNPTFNSHKKRCYKIHHCEIVFGVTKCSLHGPSTSTSMAHRSRKNVFVYNSRLMKNYWLEISQKLNQRQSFRFFFLIFFLVVYKSLNKSAGSITLRDLIF